MDKAVLNRIMLSRFLLDRASESFRHPNDVGLYACVNLAQDAVEAFLGAIGDHVDAPIPERAEFDKYFLTIDQKIAPKSLPLRRKLLRLNKLRVQSKHHGIMPPRADCEEGLATARTFFEQVSEEHLQLDFTTASAVDLLADGEVKDLLVAARDKLSSGDFVQCATNCRKALYVEIEGEFDVSQFESGFKPRSLVDMMGKYSHAPLYAQSQDYIDKYVNDPTDFIVISGERLDSMLLGKGVDPTTFHNLRSITPAVWRSRETREWVVRHEPNITSTEYLSENIPYIYSTTVEIALALDAKRRGTRSSSYETFDLVLMQPDTPIYEKANEKSRVVGRTAPGQTQLTGLYAVRGLRDEKYYWKCYSEWGGLGDFLSGYVLDSAIKHEDS